MLLSDDLRARLLRDFRQATCLPEGDETRDIDGFMALWDLCCQERPFPHLSTLIRFTQELRSDDLLRLSGSRAGAAPIISTPLAISKITAPQLRNISGLGVDEALSKVTGVIAQYRYGTSEVRIMIRGYGYSGEGDRSN